MQTVKLNLIQNAEGFLREAIEKAVEAEADIHEWKFAILHLVQAIELTLKELLRKQHPWLIFEKVDERKFTVSLKTACARLRALSAHGISVDDERRVLFAGDTRNEIVHFEVELKAEELRLRFAELLVFVQTLWKNYLNGRSVQELVPPQIWRELIKIEDHGKQLFEAAKKRISLVNRDPSKAWLCKACGWKAFVPGQEMDHCFQCGYKEETRECVVCGDQCFLDGGYVSGEDDDHLAPFVCWRCDEKGRDEVSPTKF